MKIVYGVTERKGESYWTRIGVAFENKDGSLNLKLDFVPTSPDTTIQVREQSEPEQDSPPPASKGKR